MPQEIKEKETFVEHWREWFQAIFFDGLTIEETAAAFDVDVGDIEEVVAQFRRHCVDSFIVYPFDVPRVRNEIRKLNGTDAKAQFIADVLAISYLPGEALPTMPAVARVFDVMGVVAHRAYIILEETGRASEEIVPNCLRTRWFRTSNRKDRQ